MNSGLFLHNLHTYKYQTKINFRFQSLRALRIRKIVKLLRAQVRCVNFTIFKKKSLPSLTTKKLRSSKAKGPLCFLRDRHKSKQSHSLRFRSLRALHIQNLSKFVKLLRGQVRCVNFTIFF